jgi:predicted metalloprotease with PDZ domain
MWPYDYSREIETPLLWVSEGVTGYYSMLSVYRAGLRNAQIFLDQIAGGIAEIEGNEARRYISPSDASTSTWISYASPLPFSINYYTQGRTLAALLDLSIRHDTLGASGLDDVMRTLFTDVYQRGRGFSTEDLIRVINRITRSSYEGFFSRYVSGTEVPPYQTVFGYAGYRAERTTRKIPNAGANLNERGQVTGLPPGYGSEASRLQLGDIILSIDDQILDGQPGGTVFRLLAQKAGQNVRLRIQRGGGEQELEIPVGSLEIVTYRIVDGPSPTADQLNIRERWLKR